VLDIVKKVKYIYNIKIILKEYLNKYKSIKVNTIIEIINKSLSIKVNLYY
jgi:hypothetical protein